MTKRDFQAKEYALEHKTALSKEALDKPRNIIASKTYNLSIKDILHNLSILSDGYEKVASGDSFAIDPYLASASAKAAMHFISQVPVWTKTSEQLPPVDSDVLGYTIEGIERWEYAQFGDEPPRWWNTNEYSDPRITQPDYWMFLPPEPQ